MKLAISGANCLFTPKLSVQNQSPTCHNAPLMDFNQSQYNFHSLQLHSFVT